MPCSRACVVEEEEVVVEVEEEEATRAFEDSDAVCGAGEENHEHPEDRGARAARKAGPGIRTAASLSL